MSNVSKGRYGEELAVKYLKLHLYKILECNYRCKMGEIDIIAKKGSYIIFVEVKYRKNDSLGKPYEAVNYHKQRHIKNTAAFYLMEKGLNDTDCRFDVISILGKEITHFKNAF